MTNALQEIAEEACLELTNMEAEKFLDIWNNNKKTPIYTKSSQQLVEVVMLFNLAGVLAIPARNEPVGRIPHLTMDRVGKRIRKGLAKRGLE